MKLSAKAWDLSSKLIEAIKVHPFNQELMSGKLPLDKFAYYIEQDVLYLQDFARCCATIASKVPIKYVRNFLRYSEDTFISEQEIIHQFFKKTFNFKETKLLAPATLSYTSYLRHVCSNESVEVGIASLLPCFWVYRETGFFIAKQSSKNNKYARWIETYTGEDFSDVVNEVIDVFDELAKKATDETRNQMLDAFYKSTCLEWHFWNDSYNKSVFDDCCLKNNTLYK